MASLEIGCEAGFERVTGLRVPKVASFTFTGVKLLMVKLVSLHCPLKLVKLVNARPASLAKL